jgi:hypothetical protein
MGPILSKFTDFFYYTKMYVSVDYPVICNFLLANLLSPVNLQENVRKYQVDNICPWYQQNAQTPHEDARQNVLDIIVRTVVLL